jgi:Zn-dependent protease with chaperone function
MGLFSERPLRAITRGSAVEVGPRQFPQVDRAYDEVLAILDAPRRYPLFVSLSPVLGAGAVGADAPFIVLHSSTLQQVGEGPLRAILGHELGHILSHHVLYKTMLRVLLKAGGLALGTPLAGLPLLAVTAALLEWDRKSELSADRAALLSCQDVAVVREALFATAGGVGPGADLDAFRDQAARYEDDVGAVDSIVKALVLVGRSHPFPVQRISELDRWVDSGAYARVLGGDYPRRASDSEAHRPGFGEAMGGYAEGVKGTAGAAWDWVRRKRT